MSVIATWGSLLAAAGLWLEHPVATRGAETPWIHFQKQPPRSRRRVFWP
jgi:hypothetical protein